MDVIIPESYKTILEETEEPTDSFRYMKKTLFDMDLEATYLDRLKKLRYVERDMKRMTPEKAEKHRLLESKKNKSEQRFYVSQYSKQGKRKRSKKSKKSKKVRK
jgi:hypothetical protein